MARLQHAGVADGDAAAADDADPAVDAAIALLAQSPSPLALIPLEDMLGLAEQPNLPGTIDEHPNWRRRLDAPASEIARRARRARGALEHPARAPP